LSSITRQQLIRFFAWLQDEYISEPNGIAPRGKIRLSPKSIKNIHTNLSSLWAWAVDEGYAEDNRIRGIDPPRVSTPVIEPFTRDEIRAILSACARSRTWKTSPQASNERPTANRDRAIIMLLADTGMRASELCDICFGDLNLDSRYIKIRGKGPGRDSKERIVHFGLRTSRAMWKYLQPRLQEIEPEDEVFLVGQGNNTRPMNRNVLYKQVSRLGKRAGVLNAYPHRFRHTFAITYLRNGGDIFTLQALLGHSGLEMVKRYARIAQMDIAEAHRRASPVDNWRL